MDFSEHGWLRRMVLLTRHMTSLYNTEDWRYTVGSWQVQDAKSRFSEFLNTTIKKGAQVVTRRGVETAVLVPIEEWRRLQQSSRPGLKASLLGPGPRFEKLIPERRKFKRRVPVEFK